MRLGRPVRLGQMGSQLGQRLGGHGSPGDSARCAASISAAFRHDAIHHNIAASCRGHRRVSR